MTLCVDISKRLGSFTLTARFETELKTLAVLGASGAGKSLLLKCIAGIEKPDSGRIVLGDRVLFDSEKRINLSPQKRHVGYLFQNYALFPNMNVVQNIRCTAKNPESVENCIREFGLAGKEHDFPLRLSGGEQQRVALARMLCAEPELLLFDEPFSALDNHRKAEMERLLLGVLEETKRPAILVTHDRNEAYRLADSIAVMEQGRLSSPREKHLFFENPGTLAAVRLTGCKNATRLVWKNPREAFAVDWGIALSFPEKVPCSGSEKFAAFRAHYFVLEQDAVRANTFACDVKRIIEDTFSFIICFAQKGNPEHTADSLLCWEVAKEQWNEIEPFVDSGTLYARLDMTKLMLLEE